MSADPTARQTTPIERLEDQAARMVALAPFWGPPPGSNRWADIEYESEPGSCRILAAGEAVQLAIQRGWLIAKRHDEPGFVLADDPHGGEMECRWRYHSLPASELSSMVPAALRVLFGGIQ